MEKVNRAKKYSEFIRKQHKTNVVNLQNNTLEGRGLDEKYYPVEIKERFTLGSADQKREELQEKRKKVGVDLIRLTCLSNEHICQ